MVSINLQQAVQAKFGNAGVKSSAPMSGSPMATSGAAQPAADSFSLRFGGTEKVGGANAVQMKKIDGTFTSGGETLDGTFYYPQTSRPEDAKKPIVIVASGFQGVKNFHPKRFAESLTQLGYPGYGFDYKGFGKSTGERGAVTIESQVEDIQNAVRKVADRAKKEGRPIVLAGWGMAGGMVLDAMKDPEVNKAVSGVMSLNGFFNAERVQKDVRGEGKYQEFLQAFERTTEDKVDPFFIYPLRDGDTIGYVDAELSKHADEGYRTPVNRSFWPSLKRFNPEQNLQHLKDKPVLVAHGDQNELHAPQEAESLSSKLAQFNNPNNQLFWLPGAGHTEWMFGENPKFQQLVAKMDQWMQDAVPQSQD